MEGKGSRHCCRGAPCLKALKSCGHADHMPACDTADRVTTRRPFLADECQGGALTAPAAGAVAAEIDMPPPPPQPSTLPSQPEPRSRRRKEVETGLWKTTHRSFPNLQPAPVE